ncbi:MAG: hypothetical protein RLY31_2153 [Bacteroidota bacterium]|jgi:ComF family protein
MKRSTHLLPDLLSFFFPHLCLVCESNAPPAKDSICSHCRADLPETDHHLTVDNPFAERFWGRVPVESAAALLLFTRGGKVRRLLHRLKYKGEKEIGWILGRELGWKLLSSPLFSGVELVVPVPLHPKKERARGYNQSAVFGAGVAEAMGIRQVADGLQRTTHGLSQTRKTKEARIASLDGQFQVQREALLRGRHILLVDDVMTTGATLEVCTECLSALPGTRVSLATIAMTSQT